MFRNQHLSLVRVACFVLGLAALITASSRAQAQVTIRPIEDFVKAQGTFCFPAPDPVPVGTRNVGGCWEAIHAQFDDMPNFVTQVGPALFPWAFVDYAGLTVNYIKNHGGPTIPTTFSGQITERARPDGRADVTVMLFTSNALVWVVDECECHGGPGNVLMGNTPDAIIQGATPVLADSFFKIQFVNSYPGAPMPDFFQLALAPDPSRQFVAAGFNSKAFGPMHFVAGVQEVPEGTRGMLSVAISDTHSINAFIHGVPTLGEVVTLKPVPNE